LVVTPLAALLLTAAASPGSPPEPPRGGVQAVALATVEIIASARGTIEAGPREPRRQVRRDPRGRATVEFE